VADNQGLNAQRSRGKHRVYPGGIGGVFFRLGWFAWLVDVVGAATGRRPWVSIQDATFGLLIRRLPTYAVWAMPMKAGSYH